MTTVIRPPFTQDTARQKVQIAQDLWNSKNPDAVVLAYTVDSIWRNRTQWVVGHREIGALLTRKWQRELDYKLNKELFIFSEDRIAVNFTYEYHDADGQWYRAHGLEHWQFNVDGLMQSRQASINEERISPEQRVLSDS